RRLDLTVEERLLSEDPTRLVEEVPLLRRRVPAEGSRGGGHDVRVEETRKRQRRIVVELPVAAPEDVPGIPENVPGEADPGLHLVEVQDVGADVVVILGSASP